MQGPGRADIVNAGSGETGYSECGVRGYSDSVKDSHVFSILFHSILFYSDHYLISLLYFTEFIVI
ncbi:unnamed protein product, partial [Staurois parvus]